MQKDIISMTEAPGVNDVPSAAEVLQLIRQAEKDDKKASLHYAPC